MKPSKYPHFAILNVPFKLMPTTAQSKLFNKLDKSAKHFLIVVHHLRNSLLPYNVSIIDYSHDLSLELKYYLKRAMVYFSATQHSIV